MQEDTSWLAGHLSGNAERHDAAAWDGHILAGAQRAVWGVSGCGSGLMVQRGVSRDLMFTREVTVSPSRARQEGNRHRAGPWEPGLGQLHSQCSAKLFQQI